MGALRYTAAMAAAIGLAACQAEPVEEPAAEDTAGEDTVAPVPAPAATAEPGTMLPSPEAAFRYTGRWAESVEQCRGEAWTFTRNHLAAPGGISCEFTTIEKSPGGYAIDAICTAEGEEEDNNITLRFAESAKAMLVEGATSLPETGLVYCGDTAA